MPITVATVTVTPPEVEESNKRLAYRESRSRSVSMSRERSMSPLSKIQEQHEEEFSLSYSPLRSSLSLNFKNQEAIVDEPQIVKSHSLDDKAISPTTPREDDDTVIHGSSEFMLVLYPQDQDKKLDDIAGRRKSLGEIITENRNLFHFYNNINKIIRIQIKSSEVIKLH